MAALTAAVADGANLKRWDNVAQGPGGSDGVVDSVDTELNGTSLDTTLGRTIGADLADSVDLSSLAAGGTTPHPDDNLVAGSHHRQRYNTPALSYFGGQLHGIRLSTSSNSIYIVDIHGTQTKVVDGVYLGDSAGDFGGAQVTTEFTAFVDTDRLKIVSRDAIGTVVTDIDVLDGLDAVDDWAHNRHSRQLGHCRPGSVHAHHNRDDRLGNGRAHVPLLRDQRHHLGGQPRRQR